VKANDTLGHEFLEVLSGNEKYRQEAGQMVTSDARSLVVDYSDIAASNPDAAVALHERPDEALPALKQAAYELLSVENTLYADSIRKDLTARVRGVDVSVPLRKVGAVWLNKLISITGMVVRSATLKPLTTAVAFKCGGGHLVYGEIEWDELKIERPTQCDICGDRRLRRDPRLGTYVDHQVLRIQELPEELPPGQTPSVQDIVLLGDLVDTVRPGDKVVVTGIPRALSNQYNRDSAVGEFRVECNHIEAVGKEPELSLTKEEEESIKTIANQPGAYENLVGSIAPAILGHRRVKEAILLLLAGSPAVKLKDGVTLRGDINVLLVGDPAIAKSELLRFAARAAPRGIYASGKGSSAAGLSAAVVKEKDSGFVLEVGVTVLADLGISSIDEFDKMRPEDRSALHSIMEQQLCTIAKGGIYATLNARTAILAAMNPVLGNYNPYQSLVDNIGDIPVPLLSRFDLIFVMRDNPSADRDSELAEYILTTRQKGDYATTPSIDPTLLRKYIVYAKRINPKLSDAAKERIKEFWLELRRGVKEGMIGATPRTLESLHRLATARARVLLREKVTEEDASAAIELMKKMTEEILTEKEGGEGVDFGVITVGKTHSERSQLEVIRGVMKNLEGAEKKPVEAKLLKEELLKTGKFPTTEDIDKAVSRALRDGILYEAKLGFFKLVAG
jgi:replicative DNA helicase Mcm